MSPDLNDWLQDETRRLRRKYKFDKKEKVRHCYKHFDPPIAPEQMMDILRDPKKVAEHSFLPLLRFHEKTRKFTVDLQHPDGFWKPKPRPISYASHADAYIFSLYERRLAEKYEKLLASKGIGDCVLAYRKGDEVTKRSTIHSSYAVFKSILDRGECTAMTFDIEKFFENLDHGRLFYLWKKLLAVPQLGRDHQIIFNNVTGFAFIELKTVIDVLGLETGKLPACLSDSPGLPLALKKHVRKNGRVGIPQGCAMSGTLSNLYMIGCDTAMHAACAGRGALYRRYSDDIIIVCNPDDADDLQSLLQSQLTEHKLKMNIQKTHHHDFRRTNGRLYSISKSRKGIDVEIPLQYLGFTFDGQFCRIRDSSLSRFRAAMEKGIDAEVAYQFGRVRFFTRKALKRTFVPQLRKHRLYIRYSDLGEKTDHRNFLTYMDTAHASMKGISKINTQKAALSKVLQDKIQKAEKRLILYRPVKTGMSKV